MDDKAYLKRFFIELYNDENMYYEYLQEQISLDVDLYIKWVNDMNTKNMIFAKGIRDFNRINSKTKLIESSLSEDLSVSKNFINKSEIVISEFGKFNIKEEIRGNSCNHYICNGYYIDTLEQIYKVLENGAFTVGICAEKKSELYKDVVKHYTKLRSFLFNNGYHTSALETNCCGKNRVYLLMYDHKIRRR